MISAIHSSMLAGSFDISDTLWTIGQIGAFIGGTIAIGVFFVPRIFALIAKLERYEITIMSALGIAFGLARTS